MGFLASSCKEYVCCEPSTKTFVGLTEISDTYSYLGKQVTLINQCQEDYQPPQNYFDFAFTSPPYFDNEKYCEEKTQSYIRYKTLAEWREGFLRPLVVNAYNALKPDGTFILNIANTKNAKDIEQLSVTYASEVGFCFQNTIKLSLSSISGKGVKYEPMFIFKKTNYC